MTVTRSDGALTATWPAISDATKYHVTYSTDNRQSWSLAALDHTTNSITISGDNAKTYIVGVRAGNDNGWSGWRNSPAAGPYTPPNANPPGPVAGVSLTRADGAVTADWNAPSGATKYHVTYTTDNGKSWSLAALNYTSSAIIINNADNAKTYVVGVRAGNAHGWSDWRNSPAIGPYTPPVAPIGLTAARGDDGDTANVSWTAYTGDDFEYYRVIVCNSAQYNGHSCSGTVFTSTPSYDANDTGPVTVPGLNAGTGYGIILQVWRNGSALKRHATLPAGPAAPANLSVTPGDGYLDIEWDAVTDATGYDVRAKKAGASDWHDVAGNLTETSYRYTTTETMDYVAVRARNANGPGNWTELSRLPAHDWLTTVRTLIEIKFPISPRSQLIIPVAVKRLSMQRQSRHLGVRCHHAGRVRVRVEPRLDPKPRCRSCTAYQVNNGLKGAKHLAPPVLRDVAKQTVFDLVPLARARRQMADVDAQARVVRKLL